MMMDTEATGQAEWSGHGNHPALVRVGSDVWLVYQKLSGGRGQVCARRVTGGEERELSPGGIDCADIAAAAYGDGAVVVWSQLEGDVYRLWSADLLNPGERREISHGPEGILFPSLAAAPDGPVALVYQAADPDGEYRIWLRTRAGDGDWSEPACVSRMPGNCWCPHVAVCGHGERAVVWDGYAAGSYDVYLRTIRLDMTMAPIVRVSSGHGFHAHAAVAAASGGGLYVAWNSDGEEWGWKNRPDADGLPAERKYLHARRRIELRYVDGGRASLLAEDVQKTLLDAALPGQHHERPRLFVAANGAVCMAFRYNEGSSAGVGRTEKRWQAFFTCCDGEHWLPPVCLPDAYGFSTGGISMCEDPAGGLVIAAAGEGGDRLALDVETGTYLYRYRGQPPAKRMRLDGGVDLLPVPRPRASRARHRVVHGGATYHLYDGDLHRHTEMALCCSTVDGTPEEAFRYGRDAARLDFVATTDHASQTSRPDIWAQSTQAANRFNVPGRFTTFFAYEWNGSGIGTKHRIIVSAEQLPPQPFDVEMEDGTWYHNIARLWDTLPRGKAITIPHTTASPGFRLKWGIDPFEAADAEMEPLVEIYQATTCSSECLDALEPSFDGSGRPHVCDDLVEEGTIAAALRMGLRMGFIASSDHTSTQRAFACVYARENTREALMEAMVARRTFAATDRIVMEFSLGGGFMGDAIAAEGDSLDMRFRVEGTSAIKEVVLLRDSEPYRAWPGRADCLEVSEAIGAAECKGHYFYVRAVQDDTNMAWSSPVWVA